jgi:hypothetical protein
MGGASRPGASPAGGQAVSDSPPDRSERTARQHAEDWWSDIDREILGCLAEHESMTPAEIGSSLGLSEGEVVALLAMLAPEGKVTICQVKLGSAA